MSAGFIGIRPRLDLARSRSRYGSSCCRCASWPAWWRTRTRRSGAPAEQGWSTALVVLTVAAVIRWPARFTAVAACGIFSGQRRCARGASCGVLSPSAKRITGPSRGVSNGRRLRLGYFFWLRTARVLRYTRLVDRAGHAACVGTKVAAVRLSRRIPADVRGDVSAVSPARFAAEKRLRALFDVSGVRRRFLHAPWAFLVALLLTLPVVAAQTCSRSMCRAEAAWLPSLFFVAFNLPAR